ncbi:MULTISPECIES: hypothetical protein [Streptomyces]|uniref:hypothetical protein n=1 Tax=Streptomyces TaxID=1883 RepID=UPI001319E33A|nr:MULTISPECIES: hypothetical protein [Streptomyces]MYS88173.1 hypothetical protein [Streptomyces sp. SID5464]
MTSEQRSVAASLQVGGQDDELCRGHALGARGPAARRLGRPADARRGGRGRPARLHGHDRLHGQLPGARCYPRLGFRERARIEGVPGGHEEIYFHKRLSEASTSG